MMDVQSTKCSKSKELKVAIDFGTVYSTVAFRVFSLRNGQPIADISKVTTESLHKVLFPGDDQVRTQIAWHHDKKIWLWGREVDDAIQQGSIKEKSRIEFIKLGFVDSPHTMDRCDIINRKLNDLPPDCPDRTIEALHFVFFEKLFAFAKAYIERTFKRSYGTTIFQEAHVTCIICVPVMWTASVKRRMLTIAQHTALPNPEFISEPEAASTFIIHEKLQQCAEDQHDIVSIVRKEEAFLVADIGGGTGDFMTYIYQTDGDKLKMAPGNKASGSACGSAVLNDFFRDYFECHITGATARAAMRDTGDSLEDILDMATAEFEKEKKVFKGNDRDEPMLKIFMKGVKANPAIGLSKDRILFPK